jgi:hypothetical protein
MRVPKLLGSLYLPQGICLLLSPCPLLCIIHPRSPLLLPAASTLLFCAIQHRRGILTAGIDIKLRKKRACVQRCLLLGTRTLGSQLRKRLYSLLVTRVELDDLLEHLLRPLEVALSLPEHAAVVVQHRHV